MLTDAFPCAPAIVVICDNDSIHHARAVTRYLDKHPRLELLYGARYSPHDNPVERLWVGLKNYVANTAATWPGRLRQIHAYFRSRSPDQMLATAAPWTSPWLPPGYEQNFWKPLSHATSTARGAGAEQSVRNRQVKPLIRTLSVPVRKGRPSAPLGNGQMTDRTENSHDR
jgi:hypothetical protein